MLCQLSYRGSAAAIVARLRRALQQADLERTRDIQEALAKLLERVASL